MLEGGKSQVRNGSKDGESGERRRSNDRRSEYMMRSKEKSYENKRLLDGNRAEDKRRWDKGEMRRNMIRKKVQRQNNLG